MKPEGPDINQYYQAQSQAQAQTLIDLNGIQKCYGSQSVLQDFSLTLQAGEICGFVGANGGGKTTAMRIISGLLKPNSGGGKVLDFDLLSQSTQIRCAIGYMTQHHALYKDLTVIENLWAKTMMYDLDQPQSVIDSLLQRLELQSIGNRRVGILSGGWARRAQFAAALVHRPQLLLLDEPTTGLDIHSREMLWKHIARLAEEGTACLISTHDLYEAQRCHKMAVFVRGRIVALDSPQNLMHQQNVSTLEAAILELTREQNESR